MIEAVDCILFKSLCENVEVAVPVTKFNGSFPLVSLTFDNPSNGTEVNQ